MVSCFCLTVFVFAVLIRILIDLGTGTTRIRISDFVCDLHQLLARRLFQYHSFSWSEYWFRFSRARIQSLDYSPIWFKLWYKIGCSCIMILKQVFNLDLNSPWTGSKILVWLCSNFKLRNVFPISNFLKFATNKNPLTARCGG